MRLRSPIPRHVLDVWPPPLPADCQGCGRRVWLVENEWVDAPGTAHECAA